MANYPRPNLPRYADTGDTNMMRYIKRFHEQLISRLGKDSVDKMRATAWQIEDYLDKHGKFADSEFIRAIQGSLEKIIQQRCKTNWSIRKARYDLRGRTTGINQFSDNYKGDYKETKKRPYVPRKLSQEITEKILEAPRRAGGSRS